MDCIILDIDGTLWDSTDAVAVVWNKVLDTRPDIPWRASSENLKTLFGKTLPDIASRIFPELSPAQQMELIQQCCEKEHDYLTAHPGAPYEGVVETIRELSEKYKVCIVSNCEGGYIELVMKALDIEKYITDFECPGYTGLDKGSNCKLVMARNGFKKAVYVGDTQGDLEASRLAGIPFVYCEYGFGQPEEWDYSIKKFPELLELF